MSIHQVSEAPNYIYTEQNQSSFLGMKLGERGSSFGRALLATAEIVQNAVLGIIGLLATALTFGQNESVNSFTHQKWEQLLESSANFTTCFTAIFYPPAADEPISDSSKPRSAAAAAIGMTSIASNFAAVESVAVARENRIRSGDANIHERLARELSYAKNQETRVEPKAFRYLAAPAWFDAQQENVEVGNYEVGICSAQGHRHTMEDEHIASSFTLELSETSFPVQLFGVFDGHGGNQVSKFLKDLLQQKLAQTLKEFNPNDLSDKGIWNALKLTCVRLNREISENLRKQGSTATFSMILDGKIWTANVGDSRTILNNGGRPLQLSEDAKPDMERYAKGIIKRGGYVGQFHGYGPQRVNRSLSVARAFGDHNLEGAITARPKITVMPLGNIKAGSHLILACDGIYDVATTKQIANAVHMHAGEPLDTVAKNIAYSAYAAGSGDNLSVLVVKL